jgi:predicted RNase H-like nuclease (RuvC/YqgF family)
MKAMSDLLWRLTNRREMVNYGNGDVRDIPDEDCVEAAAELTRLREQCEAKDAEIERLKAELATANQALSERWNETAFKNMQNCVVAAEHKLASLSAENERLRKALKNAHDFGCMSFCWATNHEEQKDFEKQQAESWEDFCQQTALAAHVGEGEKDGME